MTPGSGADSDHDPTRLPGITPCSTKYPVLLLMDGNVRLRFEATQCAEPPAKLPPDGGGPDFCLLFGSGSPAKAGSDDFQLENFRCHDVLLITYAGNFLARLEMALAILDFGLSLSGRRTSGAVTRRK